MEFYAVLATATVLIASLAIWLFVKTRHIGFPVGLGLFYYWSLYGAWWVVMDQRGGDSGKRYDYLATKMFPIELDEHYLWVLVLYAGFIILIEIVLLALVVQELPPGFDDRGSYIPPLRISHVSILALAVVSIAGSFLIMADQLASAAELNVSAYLATRGGLGEYHSLFTLHQILNRMALFALAIGIAVFLAGDNARFVTGGSSAAIGCAYMVIVLASFGYLAILGNKNELFSALILGAVFYVNNTTRLRWRTVAPLGGAAFLAIAAIDFLRGLPVLALLESKNWWEALGWVPEIRSSNEAFAAHFSLYGVLHFHAPLTYGASIIALAASIVPRLFWPDRPEGSYVLYAESLGIYEGPTGQGYTVHHATGWYLNFGLWGLIAGAILLGVIWAWCYNAHCRVTNGDPHWRNILAIIAPAGFVSDIPPLVRAGPDAYKGLIVDGLIIPTIIILVASVRWSKAFQDVRAQHRVPERQLPT